MTRLPLLFLLGLVIMWLLLNQTVAPGQVLLGTAVGAMLLLTFRAVRPVWPRVRRPQAAILLFLRVLVDIVRSNIGVARVILGLVGERDVKSGFLRIPLELRDPHGLAALAAILTSTPGTVWVDLTRDGSTLTVHVLDLQDEQQWIRMIKDRYERPLMEIFD